MRTGKVTELTVLPKLNSQGKIPRVLRMHYAAQINRIT